MLSRTTPTMEELQISRIEKVAVIVNPASGGSPAPLRELNEALLPFRSTIQVTQSEGDGSRFCRDAVAAEVDLVIVFGGDGTVRQVLSVLAGTDIPVLVLRGGTGNLIADELDMPADVAEPLAFLKGETIRTQTVDLGLINRSTCFVLRCGCGLEVKALHETEDDEKSSWGKLAYAGGLLKAIQDLWQIEFRIWLDDETEPINETGVALTIANSGRIGVGTLQITPNVNISDGLLDVCVIEKAAFKTLVELLSVNLSGNSGNSPGRETTSLIRNRQAKRVRVETEPPIEFQADGDIIGMTPFEIEVLPAAARLVIAPETKGGSAS